MYDVGDLMIRRLREVQNVRWLPGLLSSVVVETPTCNIAVKDPGLVSRHPLYVTNVRRTGRLRGFSRYSNSYPPYRVLNRRKVEAHSH